MENKVSVITVVYNDENGIEGTIESVLSQIYKNIEFIVIDGNSNDNTYHIINKYRDKIDILVSENDRGIYDAMNKGIENASGDWIIFMNSGDMFYDKDVLNNIFQYSHAEHDCIYSDVSFFGEKEYIIETDINKVRINHQALLYRKGLHEEYGKYLVSKKVTISDYLFFNKISTKNWFKTDNIIAKCNNWGVSSNTSHYYQKLGVDLMFNRRSKITIAALLLLFPIYRKIRILMFVFRSKNR